MGSSNFLKEIKGRLKKIMGRRDDGGGAQGNMVKFKHRELKTATDDFYDTIGFGRFGHAYRGTLKRTGQVIVVKNLRNSATHNKKTFKEGITWLSSLHHPNLVNLIGYCSKKDHRLIVYEFVPLGSLASHLYGVGGRPLLDWNTRMKIAHGVARGLNYLHNRDHPVVFRDLNSNNILLDVGFNPKLSDFRVEMFETQEIYNRDRSSEGYLAPEFPITGYTRKSDVYSFGIAFLELISGYKPSEMISGELEGHKLIRMGRPLLENPASDIYCLADPKLNRNIPEASLREALRVAIMCAENDPEARPDMNNVVERIAAIVGE